MNKLTLKTTWQFPYQNLFNRHLYH